MISLTLISMLIEASLRGLVVAFAVWAGLRLFRVGMVLAQKIAWGSVLACATLMPLAMHWHFLPSLFAVKVPATVWIVTPKSSPIPPAPISPTAPHSVSAVKSPFAPSTKASLFAKSELSGIGLVRETAASSKVAPLARPQSGRSQNVQSALAKARSIPILADYAQPASASNPQSLALLAVLVYLAVCAALLIRIGFGLVMAVRLWLAATPYEADLGQDPERNPARGLRLRFSFSVSSPVTIGSGVLLPADCLNWDREKLRIVLAHERSHVRQADFYLQLLATIYTALFWFSPLGWWLKRKLSDLGEAISDYAGLEEAASRTSYAQLLLEFAALPRPTLIGVAMARTSNLSHRIERLLNDNIFRQAFSGSRRMMLLALLVPAALFAGTVLVRVEAAGQAPQQAPPPPPAPAMNSQAPQAPQAPQPPLSGVSNPDQAPESIMPPAPDAAPAPAPAPFPPPPTIDLQATVIPDGAPDVPPPPPPPGSGAAIFSDVQATASIQSDNVTNTNNVSTGQGTSVGRGYAYSYSSNGDSWALVTDPSEHVTFSGDWHNSTRDSINKVRKLTNGKFLFFTHEGKSYFIDDPTTLTQIAAMYAPMEALGKLQEALGRQQEELGKQQEKLGHQQELVNIPTPDLSKEIAALNAATAKLQAKAGSTVNQEELAEAEAKLAEVQERLGELQGRMGEQQGRFGEQQGRLGDQQGRLGEEQGRLGEKQGRLAEEADRKVHAIIDESLRNGKARPVE